MNGKIAVVSPPQLNVIVQAGGRGSRLRHHTWNKPKCLVSVNGKPLLYHLFDRFSGARFSVIGDYAFEQLEKYLEINPPQVELSLIRAAERGTCSGINEALSQIPVDAPLLLVWGDLMIDAMPALPNLDCPVVCTTSAFTCRWTAPESGGLQEVPGNKSGIPGIFYFSQSGIVPRPPEAGEFVRWFSSEVSRFVTLDCPDLQELGDLESLERSNDRAGFSRYFNKVTIREEEVQKEAIDPFYAHLIDKEKAWYRELGALGFRRIPDVRSEKPFVLERIKGDHPYTMLDLSQREQRAVVADCLDTLIALHDLSKAPVVEEDVTDVYVTKTLSRVESISAIIPGFDRPSVTINGRKCQNIFSGSASDTLFDLMPQLMPRGFSAIHGDPTFSNILIDDKLRAWFIDPRGYFSRPGAFGDPWYDFAKLYYSAVGGYDSFNRRKFKLFVDEETVEVLHEPPLFNDVGRDIFAEYFPDDLPRIELLHGLIWLALSGYAKDDIDSVIGSFYLGLYWLEEGLRKL